MLATILKTPVAVQISIAIMDAFVKMRHYLSNTLIKDSIIEHKLLEHDKRISLLENTFNNFKDKNNHIFYEGQIYNTYSLLLDIFESSKESIIIIDNYADKKLLDVLSKTMKNITIISSNMNEELIKKYKSQYNNIEIIENKTFHDRFIIVDKKVLYHSGASFKDLGKKCFAINIIDDNNILNELLSKLK